MPALCAACRHFEAPSERGVYLCRDCTRVLRQHLRNPRLGSARVVRAASYAQACKICGEHRDRRVVEHAEWGRICEVDILEAAEVHFL